MKRILLLMSFSLLTMLTAACASPAPPLAAAAPAAPAPADIAEAAPAPAAIAEAAPPAEGGDVLMIKEKMFIAQCNDIYLNPDDYLEKTIKLEGAYNKYTDSSSGVTYHYVSRLGPGCCGDDGVVGFEFIYDGEKPQVDAWVEAVGRLGFVEENGMKFLVLDLSELNVLEKRGSDRVYN